MNIQDIASLITIRNFIALSIDNLNVRLSREEIKAVQVKVSYLDKIIVSASLKLDLEPKTNIVSRTFVSSEPVDVVAEKVVGVGGLVRGKKGKSTLEAEVSEDVMLTKSVESHNEGK